MKFMVEDTFSYITGNEGKRIADGYALIGTSDEPREDASERFLYQTPVDVRSFEKATGLSVVTEEEMDESDLELDN